MIRGGGGICPLGVSVRGDLCPGGSPWHRPPPVWYKERAVQILLECILIFRIVACLYVEFLFKIYFTKKTKKCAYITNVQLVSHISLHDKTDDLTWITCSRSCDDRMTAEQKDEDKRVKWRSVTPHVLPTILQEALFSQFTLTLINRSNLKGISGFKKYSPFSENYLWYQSTEKRKRFFVWNETLYRLLLS